jgi:hypothetical protein
MQKLGSGSGSQWRRKRDIEGSDDNVQVDHKRSPYKSRTAAPNATPSKHTQSGRRTKILTSHPVSPVSVFRSGEDPTPSRPLTAIGVADGCSHVKVEVLSSRLCEPMVPRGGEVMFCSIGGFGD